MELFFNQTDVSCKNICLVIYFSLIMVIRASRESFIVIVIGNVPIKTYSEHFYSNPVIIILKYFLSD